MPLEFMNKKKSGLRVGASVLFTFVLSLFLRVAVVKAYWLWFISGPFELQPLSYSLSLGLCFFWGLLNFKPEEDEELEDLLPKIWKYCISMLVFQGVGFIISLFI